MRYIIVKVYQILISKLQQALIMFPGLLMPLLDKCSVNPDNVVSSHTFFGDKTQYRYIKKGFVISPQLKILVFIQIAL